MSCGHPRVWGAVSHQPLDPVNPDILFGTTSSIWGRQHDLVWAVKRIAALGLQGIELYADGIEKYRKNPMELKKIFDDAGITFIDASNGEIGQSTNFIDPDQIPTLLPGEPPIAATSLAPLPLPAGLAWAT